MAECPTRDELRSYGLEQAHLNGVPVDMYDRQITQESNWQHCRSDGSLKVSPGNAVGVAQVIQRWHPDVDVADPWASLRYSTKTMRGLYDRFGSWRKALAGYNWGSANVSGYIKPDGTVVPPWDGRRETISDQGRHYLDVILGSAWEEPTPMPTPPPSNPAVGYDDYRDPEPAGRFSSMPKGIILHGSRSGAAGNPKAKEYLGTARYEVSNPDGLGWNATIGEYRVAIHLDPQAWGWNARAASDNYLGVELAQATVDEPITDPQVAAFVDWVKTRVLPVWPGLPLVFPTHAELDGTAGYGPYHDGKTDCFPKNDPRADDLRARIMAGLQGGIPVPVPDAPTYSYVLGFADLAKRLGSDVVGLPAENEHDAERGGHPIRHQRTMLGEMVYWKNGGPAEFYRAV